jgi:hypothetical protein
VFFLPAATTTLYRLAAFCSAHSRILEIFALAIHNSPNQTQPCLVIFVADADKGKNGNAFL